MCQFFQNHPLHLKGILVIMVTQLATTERPNHALVSAMLSAVFAAMVISWSHYTSQLLPFGFDWEWRLELTMLLPPWLWAFQHQSGLRNGNVPGIVEQATPVTIKLCQFRNTKFDLILILVTIFMNLATIFSYNGNKLKGSWLSLIKNTSIY